MMEFNPLLDRCVSRGCSSSLPSVVVHICHPLLSPPHDRWSWILCCFRIGLMHRPTQGRRLVFYSEPAARFQPSEKDVSPPDEQETVIRQQTDSLTNHLYMSPLSRGRPNEIWSDFVPCNMIFIRRPFMTFVRRPVKLRTTFSQSLPITFRHYLSL